MALNIDIGVVGISILVLAAGYMLGRLVEKATLRMYEKAISRRARETGLEEIEAELGLEKGLRSLISGSLKYIVYTVAILIVLDLVGLTPVSQILLELVRYSPNIVGALLILIFGFMVAEILESVTLIVVSNEKLGELFRDVQLNISGTIGLFVKYYVYLIALAMALTQLGFAALPLTIIVGVVSMVAGAGALAFCYLSAKDLVPNISAGYYIRSRGIVRAGDKVVVGDIAGIVEEVGAVHSTLRSRKRRVHVPNALLIKSIIQSEGEAN